MPKRFAKIVQRNDMFMRHKYTKPITTSLKVRVKWGPVVVLAPGITRMLEKLISLYVLLAL